MKSKQKVDLIDRIPNSVWMLISLITAVIVWELLSINPKTARSFPHLVEVFSSGKTMLNRGVFFRDIASSMTSAFFGFCFGFFTGVPVGCGLVSSLPLYRRALIQFIRNIPPLAYVPLVVISVGSGPHPTDYRYLAGHFPNHLYHRLSGRDQCG